MLQHIKLRHLCEELFFFQIPSFSELSEMRLPPSYEESFMNGQSHLIGIREVTLNASKYNTIKYSMLKMRKMAR